MPNHSPHVNLEFCLFNLLRAPIGFQFLESTFSVYLSETLPATTREIICFNTVTVDVGYLKIKDTNCACMFSYIKREVAIEFGRIISSLLWLAVAML
jgi:hypothetical protein